MRCHPVRWLWGLIPVAMLSWLAVHAELAAIQDDLERRSRAALAAAGHDWASVAFDGRDGLLVGQIGNDRRREEAADLVRHLWGVRVVRTRVANTAVIADIPIKPATQAAPPAEVLGDVPPVVIAELHPVAPQGVRAAPPAQPVAAVAGVRAHDDAAAAGHGGEEVKASALPPLPVQKPTPVELAPAATIEVAVQGARPQTDGGVSPAAAPAVAREPIAPQSKITTRVVETATAAPERSPGVRDPRFDTAALPPGNNSAPPACAGAVETAAKGVQLHFARGDARLDTAGKAVVDGLAAALNACPDVVLRVAGHADASGNSRFNRALSQHRARAVVAQLINKGIDAGRLVAVGYGDNRPVAPNDTQANRAKNRRIELTVAAASAPLPPLPVRKQGTSDGLSRR